MEADLSLKDKALFVLLDLRGLARTANREEQLDSFELRHLARATLEAQLDSCELRHLECAANR